MKPILLHFLKRVFDFIYEEFLGICGINCQMDSEGVSLIGHRGVMGHPELKENTIPAFDMALSRSAGIEFDLQLTKDEVAMVHHDPNLRRVHNLQGELSSLTYKELREKCPAVPSLHEVLDRYQDSAPLLFIEHKLQTSKERNEILASLVYEQITKRKLLAKCVVISLKTECLEFYRTQYPELQLASVYLISPKKSISYVRQYPGVGLLGWYFWFPINWIPYFKKKDLPYGVGFINWPRSFNKIKKQGFTLIFSDRIDRLLPPNHSGK